MDFMLLRDEKVLNAQCDGFEALLRDRSISELDIKRYIQNNKYYHIPASIFSNYTFGHHEAVLFKEFPLGTQYVVDYLWQVGHLVAGSLSLLNLKIHTIISW